MSKGSTPRPSSISKEEFDRNWERIFEHKNKKDKSLRVKSKSKRFSPTESLRIAEEELDDESL